MVISSRLVRPHVLGSGYESNVLSARGAQVRDTGITVNGHEQIEFREQRT
jgi:hypothetical protein